MIDHDSQLVAALALIDVEPPGAGNPGGTIGLLQRLCAALARALSARGAGITVMTEAGAQPVAIASDSHIQVLDEQQFSFGEGPCVDCFAWRRPVLCTDLSAAAVRWPGYARAAHDQGIRAVFAFPLQIGAACLGVLNLYRDQAGPISSAELTRALAFADVAVEALLEGWSQVARSQPVAGAARPGEGENRQRNGENRQRNGENGLRDGENGPGNGENERENGGNRTTGGRNQPIDDNDLPLDELESAMGSRAELFQAQGMIMIQLGVSLTEAMVRLRAFAYASERRIGDVAHDVVARRLIFESDDGGTGG